MIYGRAQNAPARVDYSFTIVILSAFYPCHPERNAVEPKDPTNGVHYRPMGSFGYAQDDTVGVGRFYYRHSEASAEESRLMNSVTFKILRYAQNDSSGGGIIQWGGMTKTTE
jgi:hypothetical protein